MSDDIREALRRELITDLEARGHYADMLLDSMVALQIKTLRQQRDWTQKELAEAADMKQSRISAMEKIDYSSWSIRTLKRLARAFDLRLRVTFESFESLLEDYTHLGRADLERPSFDEDPAFAAGVEASSEQQRGPGLADVVFFPDRPTVTRVEAPTATQMKARYG